MGREHVGAQVGYLQILYHFVFDAPLASFVVAICFVPLSWDGGKYIFIITCILGKHKNAIGIEGDSWHIPPSRCHRHWLIPPGNAHFQAD